MENLSTLQFFRNSFIEDGSDSSIKPFIDYIGIHQLFFSKNSRDKNVLIFKYDNNNKLLDAEERQNLLNFLDSAKGRLLKRIVNIQMNTYNIKINTNSRANFLKYIKKFYGKKNVVNGIDYFIDETGISFPFTYFTIPYNDFKRLFFLLYSLKTNSNVKLGLINKALRIAIKGFIDDEILVLLQNYLSRSQLVILLHNFLSSSLFNDNSLYNNRSANLNIKFLNDQLLSIFDLSRVEANNSEALGQELNAIQINVNNGNSSSHGGKKIKKAKKKTTKK